MLAKQITSKLKQDQEAGQSSQQNNNLNVTQCDRLIRTVSCKHDTNPTIKKTNINVLQPFHETKLYISPHYLNNQQQQSNTSQTAHYTELSNSDSQHQAHTIIDATFSTKLKRRNESASRNEPQSPPPTSSSSNQVNNTNNTINNNNNMSDTGEVNVKDLLDQIVDNLTCLNVSQWFAFNSQPSSSTTTSGTIKKESLLNVSTLDGNNLNESSSQTIESPIQPVNMFDSIHQALNHIDFNLKRNSDFINELTKLLDTSRALKLETQLKKMSKLLEEEKLNATLHHAPTTTAASSQPGSPSMRSAGSANHDDDDKKKSKSKSFKLSTLSLTSKSDSKHAQELKATLASQTNTAKEISESLLNIEANFKQHMQVKSHEINNSDYIELEKEVEKISYELDSLFRSWSRICNLATQQGNDQLKNIVEFQILINNLNSSVIVKELEKSLFKLNWLITSKSGFNEPNWQSCVLSLTPSTSDSFIGVNLLKNYYKYVKYDFVSYKLFTRQLQLIQLCAIILNAIHRILIFYRETITLSNITNNVNGPNGSSNDMFGSSLLSFNFSSDKYRPISWSANHVTLYNVQNSKAAVTSSTSSADKQTKAVSRASSTRRDEARSTTQPPLQSKEDQIKQIKTDCFIKELTDFLTLTTNRLNIQAHMANRTGYFYIVNQSTGLVLQAVDFNTDNSLKELIEQNQKRLQNTSIKSGGSGKLNNPSSSNISKGPRFYLMNKITPSAASNSPSLNKSDNVSSTLVNTDTQTDEQLWYYYLINGCVANKIIRSGYCMAASSLNAKSPVCFWPNVKTTNCSWFFNSIDQTIVSGLSDDLVLDYVVIDEPPNQRYAVVIDTKVPNKVSQKWSFEFC